MEGQSWQGIVMWCLVFFRIIRFCSETFSWNPTRSQTKVGFEKENFESEWAEFEQRWDGVSHEHFYVEAFVTCIYPIAEFELQQFVKSTWLVFVPNGELDVPKSEWQQIVLSA